MSDGGRLLGRGRPRLRPLLLAALLTTPAVLEAEAWPRGAGKLFAHLGASTARADEILDPAGTRLPFPGRKYEERGATLYFELGLTDRLTFVSAVPYREVVANGRLTDFSSLGFGDLDARLRYSVPAGPAWIGFDAGLFVPLGYDPDDFPQLGSGKTDLLLAASFGTSLSFLPEGFASLDVGYRVRGGPLRDELPYAVKVGAFPLRRVGLFLFARGWKSRADFSGVETSFGLVTADSERHAAGAELYVRLGRGVDVNGSFARVYAGRNTVVADQLVLGIAFATDLLRTR